MANILVVDDEIGIRELLSEILSDEGHVVVTAENASAARAARLREQLDLVLLDIWMPDTDGVTLLKEWASQRPADDAGDHDVRPRDDRHRGGGHALRRPRVPREADRHGAAAVGGPQRAGARARDAQPSAAAGRPLRSRSTPSRRRSPRLLPARDAAAIAEPEPARHNGVPLDQPLRDARDQFERVYFEYHLAREGFSMTRVADRAGLERTHLYRKLKQLGIELARGKGRAERVEEPVDVPPVVEARDAANEPRVYVQRDDYDD